jgi:hypothetical protein
VQRRQRQRQRQRSSGCSSSTVAVDARTDNEVYLSC